MDPHSFQHVRPSSQVLHPQTHTPVHVRYQSTFKGWDEIREGFQCINDSFHTRTSVYRSNNGTCCCWKALGYIHVVIQSNVDDITRRYTFQRANEYCCTLHDAVAVESSSAFWYVHQGHTTTNVLIRNEDERMKTHWQLDIMDEWKMWSCWCFCPPSVPIQYADLQQRLLPVEREGKMQLEIVEMPIRTSGPGRRFLESLTGKPRKREQLKYQKGTTSVVVVVLVVVWGGRARVNQRWDTWRSITRECVTALLFFFFLGGQRCDGKRY